LRDIRERGDRVLHLGRIEVESAAHDHLAGLAGIARKATPPGSMIPCRRERSVTKSSVACVSITALGLPVLPEV
jgi:hypothetical protein